MSKKDIQGKVFVLGDTAVGKTCLLLRYTEEKFSEAHLSTLGVDYRNKVLTRKEKKIKLQLWDTAGQERYRTIAKQMYKNAQAIVLVYDITNRETYNSISVWLQQINENIGSDILKVLVGNKCDLEDKRVVTEEEGKIEAQKHNIPFYEASSFSNKNVSAIFEYLADKLIEDHLNNNSTSTRTTIDNRTSKKTCC